MTSNRHQYFIQSKQQQTLLSLALLYFELLLLLLLSAFILPVKLLSKSHLRYIGCLFSIAVHVRCDKKASLKPSQITYSLFTCLWIYFRNRNSFTLLGIYVHSSHPYRKQILAPGWIKWDICIFSPYFFFFLSLLQTNSNWNPLNVKSTFSLLAHNLNVKKMVWLTSLSLFIF